MIKNKIPAIFNEDLITFLQEIKEYDFIASGERYCNGCAKVISFDNIQLIIPKAGGSYNYYAMIPNALNNTIKNYFKNGRHSKNCNCLSTTNSF